MELSKFNDQNRPLEPGKCYHIFNRGNQKNPIFFSEENYRYFLSKYNQYLSGYVDTFAYCLLNNHFHILLRLKNENEILDQAKQLLTNGFGKEKMLPNKIVSEQFRRFFLSYAKAINKQEQLTGSVFQKYFRRKLVDNDLYFTRLIYYIHANPELHGIIEDFTIYPWSSFIPICDETNETVQQLEVLSFFGDKEAYRDFHNRKIEYTEIEHLLIEE